MAFEMNRQSILLKSNRDREFRKNVLYYIMRCRNAIENKKTKKKGPCIHKYIYASLFYTDFFLAKA